jgi:hypothetical protein
VPTSRHSLGPLLFLQFLVIRCLGVPLYMTITTSRCSIYRPFSLLKPTGRYFRGICYSFSGILGKISVGLPTPLLAQPPVLLGGSRLNWWRASKLCDAITFLSKGVVICCSLGGERVVRSAVCLAVDIHGLRYFGSCSSRIDSCRTKRRYVSIVTTVWIRTSRHRYGPSISLADIVTRLTKLVYGHSNNWSRDNGREIW